MTPDAVDFMRNHFVGLPPHVKPVVRRLMFQSDGLKRPRWFYEGESFVIGQINRNERDESGYAEYQLLGRSVAVEPDALKHLSGRILGLRKVDSHTGLFNLPRYILVAGAAESAPGQGTGNERITNYLSIAGLAVLGGFTGMGIAWIVYGIICAVLGFSQERLFTSWLVWPVFITGWISGAIVSFFFFGSVFKSDGTSGYSRDQTRRNYGVRRDFRAHLDWWIFLGVPTPITALAVFALGRLALSNEQKAYTSVVALMVILGGTMYFCDKIPRRLLFWLGTFGWLLALGIGFSFLKLRGP